MEKQLKKFIKISRRLKLINLKKSKKIKLSLVCLLSY